LRLALSPAKLLECHAGLQGNRISEGDFVSLS